MNREEAIRWLTNEKWKNANNKYKKEWNEAFDMAIEALQAEYEDYEHATLVDIKEPLKVSVVRCKDCRHRDLFSCPLEYNDFTKDEDFCSWGERREP